MHKSINRPNEICIRKLKFTIEMVYFVCRVLSANACAIVWISMAIEQYLRFSFLFL